jgi:aminoglycoside 6'-N-acetyltransferase
VAITPWEFTEPLRTERLTLRVMTEADVDDVHAFQSDPEVVRYQLYEPRSREEVAEKSAEWRTATRLQNNDDYLQPAMQLDDGRVIGLLYFKLTSVEDLTGEIGWALHRDFHGQGYAFEAASAMLDVAFGPLGLHRVYAELDPRNLASVRLCERLGMRHEAHFVEHMMFKGDWADTGIYAILDREWRSRTG